MLSFIAIRWIASDERACRRAALIRSRAIDANSEWQTAFSGSGLLVIVKCHDPVNKVYALDADAGVVLGRLFERSYAAGSIPVDVSLSGEITDRIVRSSGKELLAGYWGRYIAFIRDVESKREWVLRDPTGNVQCFFTVVEGCHVYFSRLGELLALTPLKFTFNWRYLEGYMRFGPQNSGFTGLNEVHEVLAGEAVEHCGDAIERRFHWNPLLIAEEGQVESVEEATSKLRETTRACVHAWASCHDSLIHRLSGGVDSSIVLACLVDAPNKPEVVCLNYYSQGSDSDERIFARQMAESARCELIEWQRKSATPLDALSRIGPTPYPFFYMAYLESARDEARLSAERGATALFSGGGGDNLFYTGSSIPEAADYVFTHGLDRTALRKCMESSLLLRCSIARTLRDVIRFGVLRRRPNLPEERDQHYNLLRVPSSHRRADESWYFHPVIVAPSRVPPAKLEHASAIAWETAPRYDPWETSGDPLETTPLLSQPLIELSLAIPTYILTAGGRDRSIARLAFQNELPGRIFRRKTKGGQEEHMKAILLNNQSLIQQVLMDGHLVRNGYIDRAALNAALNYSPSQFKCDPGELVMILFLEAWLLSWSSVFESVVDDASLHAVRPLALNG